MTITYKIQRPDFDSELNRAPDAKDNSTKLTVVLRVLFLPTDPVEDKDSVKDHTGKIFKIRAWTDAEIKQYIKDMKAAVEQDWSDKIFIYPPDRKDQRVALPSNDYSRFINPNVKKPPFIRCLLRIDSCLKRCHAKLYIFNIKPGQGIFGNFVGRKEDGADTAVFCNTALELKKSEFKTRDILGAEISDYYYQTPASHEFGHILGFDHVNARDPRCKSKRNLEICYGGSPMERNDIMGVGYAVTGEHAGPWLKAIQQHTGHQKGWKASHISPDMEELFKF